MGINFTDICIKENVDRKFQQWKYSHLLAPKRCRCYAETEFSVKPTQ